MIHLTNKTLSDPIIVVGLNARTTNAREMSGEGSIAGIWKRFLAENLAAGIPNRSSESLFAVYSNYAGNEDGEYDFLLGSPVDSSETLPEGMSRVEIMAGEYAAFTTESGPVVEVVQAAWKHIWNRTPGDMGGKRAFLTDYEVYDHRALDPANSKVEIHIGLKPVS